MLLPSGGVDRDRFDGSPGGDRREQRGRTGENRDAETTAYKTNIEAAEEICRQLRLRDLGGVVAMDLIDMRHSKHRRDIEQRIRSLLKKDRARTRVLPISQFGLMEMTRQRMRPSLKRSIYMDCVGCHGSGYVKTPGVGAAGCDASAFAGFVPAAGGEGGPDDQPGRGVYPAQPEAAPAGGYRASVPEEDHDPGGGAVD